MSELRPRELSHSAYPLISLGGRLLSPTGQSASRVVKAPNRGPCSAGRIRELECLGRLVAASHLLEIPGYCA